jgi:ankyrin repeat protein
LGNTLLHVASQNGNKRVVKLALRRGANINLRNNGGNTPLHYAYAYGFEELGEYLKAKGADDTLQNLEGLTPYEGLSAADLDAL